MGHQVGEMPYFAATSSEGPVAGAPLLNRYVRAATRRKLFRPRLDTISARRCSSPGGGRAPNGPGRRSGAGAPRTEVGVAAVLVGELGASRPRRVAAPVAPSPRSGDRRIRRAVSPGEGWRRPASWWSTEPDVRGRRRPRGPAETFREVSRAAPARPSPGALLPDARPAATHRRGRPCRTPAARPRLDRALSAVRGRSSLRTWLWAAVADRAWRPGATSLRRPAARAPRGAAPGLELPEPTADRRGRVGIEPFAGRPRSSGSDRRRTLSRSARYEQSASELTGLRDQPLRRPAGARSWPSLRPAAYVLGPSRDRRSRGGRHAGVGRSSRSHSAPEAGPCGRGAASTADSSGSNRCPRGTPAGSAPSSRGSPARPEAGDLRHAGRPCSPMSLPSMPPMPLEYRQPARRPSPDFCAGSCSARGRRLATSSPRANRPGGRRSAARAAGAPEPDDHVVVPRRLPPGDRSPP